MPPPTPAPRAGPAADPPALEPVVITGAALGLPGTEQTFDDDNVARILAGQNFITRARDDARRRMVDMQITRLVKDATSGGRQLRDHRRPAPTSSSSPAVHAPLDVVEQFGVDKARDDALDTTTRLAIGAGFDAMRDAGIPLVMSYKTTTLGTQLPDRWGLPEALRDETGVIFASAFPGYDRFAEAVEGYALDRGRREGLLAVEGLRARMSDDDPAAAEVDGARSPSCARPSSTSPTSSTGASSSGPCRWGTRSSPRSSAPAARTRRSTRRARAPPRPLSLAEDWIRAGRCRRVVVVAADDATGEHLLPWVTAGFLASGAAATDDAVEDAATPFDRRRHGMIVGAGRPRSSSSPPRPLASAGIQPIARRSATVTANSAFHGTRLDVAAHLRRHGGRWSARPRGAASTAARSRRGRCSSRTRPTPRPAAGSAAAEINALRRVFGPAAEPDRHHQHQGLHRATPWAPASRTSWPSRRSRPASCRRSPTTRSPTPTSARSTCPQGGQYPVEYALRLAAGFGSQVAMSLLRWTPVPDGRRRAPGELGYAYRVVDQAAWQRLARPARRSDREPARGRPTGDCASSTPGPPPSPVERSGHVPVPYADRLTPTRGFAAGRSASRPRAPAHASTPARRVGPVAGRARYRSRAPVAGVHRRRSRPRPPATPSSRSSPTSWPR